MFCVFSFFSYLRVYLFYAFNLFGYFGYLLFCVFCTCVGGLFINFLFIGDYVFRFCWVCVLCLSVLVLGGVVRPSVFNFFL